MFIKQHTFLGIKSEITLFFFLFMHQLYYSELVVGWRAADMDANTFFCLDGLMTGLIKAKSPKNDTRFVSNLLCYIALKAQ